MKWLGIVLCLLLAGCTVGPNVPKGEATVQERGAEALTNEVDPLVNSGIDAQSTG